MRLLLAWLLLLAAPASAPAAQWIAAWGAAPTAGGAGGPANATVRNLLRPSVGGTRVRIRLTNALTTDAPLVVGAASIAQAVGPGDASIKPGTSVPITFDGKPGITIPAKTPYVYSDPVDFPVAAQQDVAVSLFLPAAAEPVATAATWSTSFVSADGSGNLVGQTGADGFSAGASSATGGPNPDPGTQQVPLSCSGCATYALTALDVFTDEADGAYVGLASSTFHGYNSTQDGWDTVLNVLSRRINKEIPLGQQTAIVNAGIGGDTLHAGLDRVERDVFSQTGVTGVVLYDVNDLESRTADQVEEDYFKAIAMAHARGVKVFCPTWPPASQSLAGGGATNQRGKLNAWIMSSGECDDVVDWDAVLRGHVVSDEYDPAYFSDSIHPNAAGHRAMANAVPLRWFKHAAPVAGLGLPPQPAGCLVRRSLLIRVRAPHGQRLRSAQVFLNGHRVAVLRHRFRVRLRHLPPDVARVTIFVRTRGGRSYVRSREYRTCE